MATGTVKRVASSNNGRIDNAANAVLGNLTAGDREPQARARLDNTQAEAGSALRRYCSGCARETEHVLWPNREPTSIASIRWPVAEPAASSTICLDCGQLRVAAARPIPSAWSSWPRVSAHPASPAGRNGAPVAPVLVPGTTR